MRQRIASALVRIAERLDPAQRHVVRLAPGKWTYHGENTNLAH